jgi:hypothetical protein
MTGKARAVHFFSAVEVMHDGSVTPFGTEWWPDLLDALADKSEADLRVSYRGRKYEGHIQQEINPYIKYLYLGKLRPGADWPDIVDAEGEAGQLAQTGIRGLVEPLYLLPIAGTNYIAVLRTSAGPTWEALTHWLGVTAGFFDSDSTIELQPYARHNQLQRLADAVGASKIHLKFDPEGAAAIEGHTELGRAIRGAASAGAGGVSVEMIVSFGHARPEEAGSEELIEGVREVVESGSFTTAQATLLKQGPHGIERDYVNFALDRVVYTEYVGESEDETPTPSVILGAMSDAVGIFRQRLTE